jgi:outer membrane protein assembly factor BamA
MLALCITTSAFAENSMTPRIVRDINQIDEKKLTRFAIPYVFYAESLELTAGVCGGVTGLQKGQAGLYGTVFTSTNSSTAAYFLGTNLKLPLVERLFADPVLSAGWFAKKRDYISGAPDFAHEQAGSNDSDPENYIESSGHDNWAELKLKYILPMGHSRESAISIYNVDQGFLKSGATGGGEWQPFKNGVTFLQVKPFYRYRSFKFESQEEAKSTNGVEFALVHDNSDFPLNPSTGSSQRFKVARDFGWFNSMHSWTVVKGDFSKFFSLGETEKFRQRVIALNFWVSDNISSNFTNTQEGVVYSHRAPSYMGSSLGGFDRLRGYPQNRFSDKTAVYYGAEARLIPDWNPRSIFFLKFFDINWIQLVGIFEAGRVDDSWSSETFYSDLHWDAGIGIRLMLKKVVGRLDMTFSEEGLTSWVMVGQAF